MAQLVDLTGQKFGRWTVLEYAGHQGNNNGWRCRCECGTERIISTYRLTSGKTRSCGCWSAELNRAHFLDDLTGRRFGMWTVLYGPSQQAGERTKWHCKCDCGTERDVFANNLVRGMTTSCGCNGTSMRIEQHTKHGKRKTRLYDVWCDMRRRCADESSTGYQNYGGRGITVCDECLGDTGFQNFWDWAYANGYDENAPKGQCTIDRIDVNGNYCPENCRWITLAEQARNRTNTKYLSLNGETKPLQTWAEEYGVSAILVSDRLKRGWDAERALTEPPKQMWEDVEYNGEVHSYSEWARILGIKKKTIQWRLYHGWTIDEIMSPLGTVHHISGNGGSSHGTI